MQFYHYFLMGLWFRAIWIARILLVIRSSDGKISLYHKYHKYHLLKYDISVTWTSFLKWNMWVFVELDRLSWSLRV